MTFPTIHLNGSGAESLRDGYIAAGEALNDALRKLKETDPNGRDYYPQGDDAIRQASNEHCLRLNKLTHVIEEIQALAEHCDQFVKT